MEETNDIQNETNVVLKLGNDAVHICWGSTDSKSFASVTILKASINPKPNLGLDHKPAPLICQPELSNCETGLEVHTAKCWTSRQVKPGFASKANATIPAAIFK